MLHFAEVMDLVVQTNKPIFKENIMQNKLFVDTDGNPLVVGNVYVDHDDETCTVVEVKEDDCVIMRYDEYGDVPWYDHEFEDEEHCMFRYVGNSQTTVTEPVDANVGRKYDSDKPQYRLIPPYALEEVAKNLTYGARKYSEFNWKKVPNARDRYLDACFRHVEAYRKGEKVDPENGYSHLAAAAVNLMFMLEFDLNPDVTEIKE